MHDVSVRGIMEFKMYCGTCTYNGCYMWAYEYMYYLYYSYLVPRTM